MKQALQDARSGQVTVADVPAPKLLAGCLLVRTAASLVSAGTERASSEFARKNLLQKARMRPDLVREVLSKIRRDGLLAAAGAVRSRLDQPSVLGYSSAGTVIAAGEGVAEIQPGERVACAGVGHAVHAEFACVPRLLLARIPDTVTFEHAAFTTVGSVAIHGVRTADVRLGDVVAVIGLGLLGQLTVQILKAAGCSVLGIDISIERAALALRLGARWKYPFPRRSIRRPSNLDRWLSQETKPDHRYDITQPDIRGAYAMNCHRPDRGEGRVLKSHGVGNGASSRRGTQAN